MSDLKPCEDCECLKLENVKLRTALEAASLVLTSLEAYQTAQMCDAALWNTRTEDAQPNSEDNS